MVLVFFSVFVRETVKSVKSVKSVSNNHSQSVGRVQAWRIQFSYIRYTSVWRCLAVTGGVWRCLAVCWRCKRVEERPFTSQSKEFYTYSPRILLHRQPPPATASHRQTLNFRNSRISTLTDTVGGQKVSLGLFRCVEDYEYHQRNLPMLLTLPVVWYVISMLIKSMWRQRNTRLGLGHW